MMNFHVVNEQIKVGCIKLISVSSSSVIKVGDTETMQLFSASDTPLNAIEFGPLQPIVNR